MFLSDARAFQRGFKGGYRSRFGENKTAFSQFTKNKTLVFHASRKIKENILENHGSWRLWKSRFTKKRAISHFTGNKKGRSRVTKIPFTPSYYASIDNVLSELELRFSGNDQEILCALGNICHSETPDKESFPRVATFYKIDGEILEAEQKMYASFHRVRGLGYIAVSEMLETVHENDLFEVFPDFF